MYFKFYIKQLKPRGWYEVNPYKEYEKNAY